MGGSSKSEAFVTLATNDTYCQGAIVLAHSLRCNNTQKDIVVMITPQVSVEIKLSLQEYFDDIVVVDVLDSEDASHLALLKRPELGVTFTKIHCWDLTQYKKCVFMDADTMVLTNIDELFEREEFSAAADSGWPDIFNSGVFVFKPSKQTYKELIDLAESRGSFDGGDQGLLNTYFSDWRTANINKHLSFLYNMQCTSSYTYLPAFARFGKDTKVVHFIGQVKPWHHHYNSNSGEVEQTPGPGIQEMKFLKQWWKLFTEVSVYKKKKAEPTRHKITPVLEQSHSQPSEPPQEELECLKIDEQKANHQRWTSSQVDYTGADRFENIQAKIDAVLHPSEPPPPVDFLVTSSCCVTDTPLDLAVVNSSIHIKTCHILSTTPTGNLPSACSHFKPPAKSCVLNSICKESFEPTLSQGNAPVSSMPNEELDEEICSLLHDSVESQFIPIRNKKNTDMFIRLKKWESNKMDFKGVESFANIQIKLDSILRQNDVVNEEQILDEQKENFGNDLEYGEVGEPDMEDTVVSEIGDSETEVGDKNKKPLEDFDGYNRWARGEPDYAGKDSFSNIQAKLDKILNPDFSTVDVSSLHIEKEDENPPTKMPEDDSSLIASSLGASLLFSMPASTRTVSPSVPLRGILRVRTPEPTPSPEEEEYA